MDNNTFDDAARSLHDIGYEIICKKEIISIPNAECELKMSLSRMVDNFQWLDEYRQVSDWLSNNNGRGLLCIGNCGRGKTIICSKLIPILAKVFYNKIFCCYDAIDLNTKIDEMKKKHILSIDDIGTEPEFCKYGERRQPFAELVDSAEKTGKLLLLTTNLSMDELLSKYGIRTIDRLRAVTKVVHFIGNSLRGNV